MRRVIRGFACAVATAALMFAPEGILARAGEKETTRQDGVKAHSGAMVLDLGSGVKMELVSIRPGSFIMGDDKGGDDERPRPQGHDHQTVLPRQVRGDPGTVARR